MLVFFPMEIYLTNSKFEMGISNLQNKSDLMSSCISLKYQITASLKQYFQEKSWSLKSE